VRTGPNINGPHQTKSRYLDRIVWGETPRVYSVLLDTAPDRSDDFAWEGRSMAESWFDRFDKGRPSVKGWEQLCLFWSPTVDTPIYPLKCILLPVNVLPHKLNLLVSVICRSIEEASFRVSRSGNQSTVDCLLPLQGSRLKTQDLAIAYLFLGLLASRLSVEFCQRETDVGLRKQRKR